MENLVTNNKSILKCGSTIKFLSIISLAFMSLTCILNCLYVNSDNELSFYKPSSFDSIFFIETFKFIIDELLIILPFALFILYTFIFYNKLKGTIIMPMIFIINTIRVIMVLITYIINDFDLINTAIITIPPLISYILIFLSSLKGFCKEKLTITGVSILIIYYLFNIIDNSVMFLLYSHSIFYLIQNYICNIGYILFYISILWFSLKNKIPSLISLTSTEKLTISQKKPDQILRLLQRKLELNMITEEEYQIQKSEIINSL